jgi:hypothetical protein
MGTTVRTLPNRGTRRNLRAEIAQWRENVLDLDTAVDDCRRTVDAAVDAFRVAVRERDCAAAHLARLIDWHEELESISVTFGPEIADTFAAQLEARG